MWIVLGELSSSAMSTPANSSSQDCLDHPPNTSSDGVDMHLLEILAALNHSFRCALVASDSCRQLGLKVAVSLHQSIADSL